MEDLVVVAVTVQDVKNGARIAKALVEERLAACVNIIPTIRSLYRWEDKVCDDPESLLWIKTRKALLPRLQERVKALHSYDLPEVIALDIVGGLPAYLEWVAGEADPDSFEQG